MKNKYKDLYIDLKCRIIDSDKFLKSEQVKFKKIGLNYDAGLYKLNEILKQLNYDPCKYNDSKSLRGSAHWILFSCLSLLNQKFPNILEIGTYDGLTAKILAHLFPSSLIYTIDLPETDPLLRSTDNRQDNICFKNYRNKQENNLKKENIHYIEINSFFIPKKFDFKFDLIWVDGGHNYPDVAWDFCNAFHLCKENGWIMFDDIHPSFHAKELLEYLAPRLNCTISYFLKRTHPRFVLDNRWKKYVAIMKK